MSINSINNHQRALPSTYLQFSFVHGIAVLLDPLTWSESNKRTPPAHRLPSYSVYLKNTYRDLMASMDMRQSDCHSSGSNDRDRDRGRSRHLTHSLEGDDDFPQAERDKLRGNTGGQGGENIENEEEVEVEQPYCLAYNLILTSRWMMAVPRAEGAYEHVVTVNGLGVCVCVCVCVVCVCVCMCCGIEVQGPQMDES